MARKSSLSPELQRLNAALSKVGAKKLKADYYPVQRQMSLRNNISEVDFYLCDVARNLSVSNHRLYRQGKTYSCKIDLDAGTTSSTFAVFALRDTWMMQKAWQLARSTYLRATADERAVMSPSKIARWEDFRVTVDISGWTGGLLLPNHYDQGMAGAADTAGEFSLSTITNPDGVTQRNFRWGTTVGTSWGILDEYDKSGQTDPKPGTTEADNPYQGATPGVQELQMDDLAQDGNVPPYSAITMNDRLWVKVGELNATAAHGKLSTGFFNAPCGLIVIQPITPNTTVPGTLSLTVQSGDYKGVKAHNLGA